VGFEQGTRVFASVVVSKDGSYVVWLPQGEYTVVVFPQPSIGTGVTPSTVRVIARQARRVDFHIDTGIR